jgi:hypothetical protein
MASTQLQGGGITPATFGPVLSVGVEANRAQIEFFVYWWWSVAIEVIDVGWARMVWNTSC